MLSTGSLNASMRDSNQRKIMGCADSGERIAWMLPGFDASVDAGGYAIESGRLPVLPSTPPARAIASRLRKEQDDENGDDGCRHGNTPRKTWKRQSGLTRR